ncbi:MAG: hypothetical protein ACJ74O_12750 [Frankiaceae bacterium]
MWHINSVSVPTREIATIWGGSGTNVAPRALGDRLGPQGAIYVVNIPNVGALVIEDTGPVPTEWSLKVNGGPTYAYRGEGQINITVDAMGIATLSGGVGTLAVPLVATMAQSGVVTNAVIRLVAGAPSLQTQWAADAWRLMQSAGFPTMTMVNMKETFAHNPDCCVQYIAWLQTVTFPSNADDDMLGDGSWGCTLCKAFYTGMAAALFVTLVGVCLASGVGPAAIAALTEATAIETIAAAINVSGARVAAVAAAAFAAGAISSLVGRLVEAICELAGYCTASTGDVAMSGVPVPGV